MHNVHSYFEKWIKQIKSENEGKVFPAVLLLLIRLNDATSESAALTENQMRHLRVILGSEKEKEATTTCGFAHVVLATQIATWINGVHVANCTVK